MILCQQDSRAGATHAGSMDGAACRRLFGLFPRL
jgi:hypothetical protein